ncbi:class I SAM-dependent methyltransferase [Alkalicoccus urumqiensis]|uniref:Class I SAM-dependent methyltransferase n=1 Tax=Alkalicoccus urumqiensis TaxID=1548213 RepID=A0A2P6MKD2_ALKUR|nr:class I SAM-dependent methyltransferase [Alkalicoccus urumqiensis]PRO66749.1 class I SAM-dependent methyltransferase [Alkalicoccus urumqiensis]
MKQVRGMGEIQRVLKARNWMKTNENFLGTWHAHVGYKMDLFDAFKKAIHPEAAAVEQQVSSELLQRWVDVGLQVGHLKRARNGKVKAKKDMIKYASKNSRESVGILLEEMLELHIPTLLEYPALLKSDERLTYLGDKFAEVVAETSTLLEKAAVSPILSWVKKEKPASIIDLGSGYCGYLRAVYDKYPNTELIGVELSEEVVKNAREKHGDKIDIRQGDIENFLEEYDGRADMIMAHNLLYYFPPEEREDLFKRISRTLSSKGSVTVICPLVNAKYGASFTAAFNAFMTAHENLYPLPSPEDMERFAEAGGMKVETFKPLIREGGWYLINMKKQS